MARAPTKTAASAPIHSKPQIPPLNTSLASVPTMAPPVPEPMLQPKPRAKAPPAKKAPTRRAAKA